MITEPNFTVEPWRLCETAFDPRLVAHTESLFALSNGYLGIRGALEEGFGVTAPGTIVNGVFELRPAPDGERSPGDPDTVETVVPAAEGTRLRLLVDGEPLDIRTGTIELHERVLDLRAGTLTRNVRWRSPAGRLMHVCARRLVSLTERHVAAIAYSVEPLDGPARVTVESDLSVDEWPAIDASDPRSSSALPRGTLVPVSVRDGGMRAVLAHRVRLSGLHMAAGMEHHVTGHDSTTLEVGQSLARLIVTADAAPGRPLRIEKLLAYAGGRAEPAALATEVGAGLDAARRLRFEGLAARQRTALGAWWARADVELDGDPHVQQAVRFGLFHLFQAAACAGARPIAAKGLTGQGYDGHAFWDTETFVLPVLTYTMPELAKGALQWRHATLGAARDKARRLGLAGAAFPWRTLSGHESSSYFPAGTAAFHVNADIADAVIRYTNATGDESFERTAGAELLVETARLWARLGYHDAAGAFHIDGVTGPDEYSVLVDDNVYTNLMAQANLRAAAAVVERHGPVAGARPGEVIAWRRAADAMAVPFDATLRVHAQDADFTRHDRFAFEEFGDDGYPLLLHVPYFDLYRRQVVKQPDLVLALHLRGEAFTSAEKARAFAYYEPLTVRDSSLAAATNAVIAAELGFTRLAHDYLAEAALLDVHDVADNTRDGMHLAALAGGWIAAVAGLAGLRDHGGQLRFAPRLPAAVHRMAFRLAYRGRSVHIEVNATHATYLLERGDSLELKHFGEPLIISHGTPARLAIPPAPTAEPPHQPPGRAPARHHPDRHVIERDPWPGTGEAL